MKSTNIKAMRAFSLAEVLISLIIVSVLMIILAPMITKSMIKTKGDGITFVYSPENNTTQDNVCFLTQPEYSSGSVTGETYITTRSCSEYSFEVPEGVTSVNLTLVAGGGGGGGASGGIMTTTDMDLGGAAGTIEKTFFGHTIKNIRINALTGKGVDGLTSETLTGGSAGTGGKSSSALIGLEIPSKYIRGLNYIPSNSDTEDVSAKIIIDTSSAKISLNNTKENSSVVYNVPFQTPTPAEEILQPSCIIGGNTLNLVYDCGANKNNYFAGSLGQGNNEAGQAATSGTVQLNSVLWGGEGGKIPQIPNGYGWGGKNSDYILSKCDGASGSSQSCNYSDSLTYTVMTGATQAGGAYGSMTITTETPGVGGGGGAGGTVVRITNFAVTPGEQYIIRVGKGGEGGRAGLTGKNGQSEAGKDGESGVSTSIYKVVSGAEILAFMVNGGAGGNKGNLNVYGSHSSVAAESGRNRNAIFSESVDLATITTDTSIGGQISPVAADSSKPSSSWTSAFLTYPIYQKVPFDYLGYLKDYAANTLWADRAWGGHSAFNTTYSDCTVASNQRIYCGVLPKVDSKGTFAYAGGLGGFSGLGTKAGCGGYYVGNNVVDITDGNYKTIRSNRFYTPDNKGAGTLKGSEEFSVFDLYDNCSIETPNGHNATFIAPDALTLNFGSAGAGGGGGGYSVTDGSGMGGSGQNGYVMIDWRK